MCTQQQAINPSHAADAPISCAVLPIRPAIPLDSGAQSITQQPLWSRPTDFQTSTHPRGNAYDADDTRDYLASDDDKIIMTSKANRRTHTILYVGYSQRLGNFDPRTGRIPLDTLEFLRAELAHLHLLQKRTRDPETLDAVQEMIRELEFRVWRQEIDQAEGPDGTS
jgi:hypothetical protein